MRIKSSKYVTKGNIVKSHKKSRNFVGCSLVNTLKEVKTRLYKGWICTQGTSISRF